MFEELLDSSSGLVKDISLRLTLLMDFCPGVSRTHCGEYGHGDFVLQGCILVLTLLELFCLGGNESHDYPPVLTVTYLY